MELCKISTRYAKAIYEYAAQKGDEYILYKELQTLALHFAELPYMKTLLDNPTIEKAQKLAVLKTAAGETISDTCLNVLGLIVNNDRVDYTYSIALMYEKIYKTAKNILSVKLQSVKPIEDNARNALVNLIARNNETVEFINQTDDTLIGGFVLEIEDKRLDASVRNQLNEIRLELIK